MTSQTRDNGTKTVETTVSLRYLRYLRYFNCEIDCKINLVLTWSAN